MDEMFEKFILKIPQQISNSILLEYLPEYHSQEKIGHTLYLIEQKIENNNCINDNLANYSAMVA